MNLLLTIELFPHDDERLEELKDRFFEALHDAGVEGELRDSRWVPDEEV